MHAVFYFRRSENTSMFAAYLRQHSILCLAAMIYTSMCSRQSPEENNGSTLQWECILHYWANVIQQLPVFIPLCSDHPPIYLVESSNMVVLKGYCCVLRQWDNKLPANCHTSFQRCYASEDEIFWFIILEWTTLHGFLLSHTRSTSEPQVQTKVLIAAWLLHSIGHMTKRT